MELQKCPLTKDEKLQMISDAAYHHSENSDPLETDPMKDWMNAVAEFEKAFMAQCTWQDDPAKKGLFAKAKLMLLKSLKKTGKIYQKTVVGIIR